ncbi:MAG TPA: hypothetical protein ENI23_02710 [bacterium]|nr:hypothetical protein [bacterium]
MIVEEITEENFVDKVEEQERETSKKILAFQERLAKDRIGAHVDWQLLYDPTVWAYHTLKDKQNNPIVLRGYQDKIINDKHRFIVVAAANQVGKTWAMCIKAIHHAIHVNNASVLIVSRSEPQSIMILDEIKWMMKRSDTSFDAVIGEVENRTELHLPNDDKKGVSVIRCLPPTTGVLAFPATLIICDEIGFWEIEGMKQSEYFNRVIVSRTNETKNWTDPHFTMGQICCISNPNAQQGVLWSLWNDEDFNQYRYCWLANPKNTIEEYLRWKKKLPTDEFDSIYAATFSSSSGGFITEEEYNDAEEDYKIQPNQVSFLGGDFAGEDTLSRDVDETVLIGTSHAKVKKTLKVKIDYYKQFPLRTKKTKVYEEIKKFSNLSKFAYDKMGVGDSVKNDLKDRGILPEYKIESLTYSLPNKSEVYYNMKHLFEQRLVILPKGLAKLKEQLLGLRFEKTDAGHIKVHHATEGLHDDWADALANSLFAAKRLLGAVPSFSALKPKESKPEEQSDKLYTLICPECEKIDYMGRNGYYEGINPKKEHYTKISCPMHIIAG